MEMFFCGKKSETRRKDMKNIFNRMSREELVSPDVVGSFARELFDTRKNTRFDQKEIQEGGLS